jgi:hypothetical protein
MMNHNSTEEQKQNTTSVVVRYVIHSEVEHYKQMGWKLGNDLSHCHHGQYAVIMQKGNF